MRLRSGRAASQKHSDSNASSSAFDATQSTVSLNQDQASSISAPTVQQSSRFVDTTNHSSSRVVGVMDQATTGSDREISSDATGSKLTTYHGGGPDNGRTSLYQASDVDDARNCTSSPLNEGSRHMFADLCLSPPRPSFLNRTEDMKSSKSDEENNDNGHEVPIGHIFLKDLVEGLALARRPSLVSELESNGVDEPRGQLGEGSQEEEDKWTDEESESERPPANKVSRSYAAAKGKGIGRTTQERKSHWARGTLLSAVNKGGSSSRSGLAGLVMPEEVTGTHPAVRRYIEQLEARVAGLEDALHATQGHPVSNPMGPFSNISSSGPDSPRNDGSHASTDHAAASQSIAAFHGTGTTIGHVFPTPSTIGRPVTRSFARSVITRGSVPLLSIAGMSSTKRPKKVLLDQKKGSGADRTGPPKKASKKVKNKTRRRPLEAYLCPWDGCKTKSRTFKDIQRHFERHIRTNEKRWICDKCGQAFTRRDASVRHCRRGCPKGAHTPCFRDENPSWTQHKLLRMKGRLEFEEEYPRCVRYK